MPTFGTLIEQIRHSLSGYDMEKDAVAALLTAMADDDLVVSIDDLSGVGKGIAEVDLEVLRVKQVDPQNSNLLLYPFGRGYRGTTATTHAVGSEVRMNPAWLASTIAREINGVLDEIYPSVYAVKTQEFRFDARYGAVPLDDSAVGVISFWFEDWHLHPNQWVRDDRWDYNPDASDVGYGLRVARGYTAVDRGRVVYATRPGKFDLAGSLDQDFAAVTGLDNRAADLMTLGVAYRMAPYIDVGRLPFLSASARENQQLNPYRQNGGEVAKLLYSLFTKRLDQEAMVLAKEHPIRVHAVR